MLHVGRIKQRFVGALIERHADHPNYAIQRAARLEKPRRVGKKEAPQRLAPGEVETDAEPTREPHQILGGHGTRVE